MIKPILIRGKRFHLAILGNLKTSSTNSAKKEHPTYPPYSWNVCVQSLVPRSHSFIDLSSLADTIIRPSGENLKEELFDWKIILEIAILVRYIL